MEKKLRLTIIKETLNAQLNLLKDVQGLIKNHQEIMIDDFRNKFCWASLLPPNLSKITDIHELREVIRQTKKVNGNLPDGTDIKEKLKWDLRKNGEDLVDKFNQIHEKTAQKMRPIKEQINSLK